MRKIWRSIRRAIAMLICLLGITLPVASSAEQFRCQVVDQIVLAADQGRSSRYSGFVGGINVGETLSVELGTAYLQISPDERMPLLMLTVSRSDGFVALTYSSSLTEADIFGDRIVIRGGNWRPDELRVGGLGDNFAIQRYYMTDWHGAFTTIETNRAYLAVINCLGADSAIQRARQEIIENPDTDFRMLPDVSDLDLVD